MKIAIVGGGIFGCTIAMDLKDAGHQVDIIEAREDIMSGATMKNQQRLHRGYHYPRSFGTAMDCKLQAQAFRERYREALTDGAGKRYYAIAKHHTKTSPEEYLRFLASVDLEHKVVKTPSCIRGDKVDLVVEVKEQSIIPRRLRNLVRQRLFYMDMPIKYFGDATEMNLLDNYDHVVVAAYDMNPEILESLGCDRPRYKYQMVQKPVVKIPGGLIKPMTSVVVMDGPFCSLDPHGVSEDQFLLGHVAHAVMTSDVTDTPRYKKEYWGGLEDHDEQSWKMLPAAAQFIPSLDYASVVGSYYTMRAVLPNVEMTDERPTIVTSHNDRVTSVFSGKIPAAATVGAEVIATLKRTDGYKDSQSDHPPSQAAV